ncbi:MAG: PAS domain S-box protein [Myxococcales bacterium]
MPLLEAACQELRDPLGASTAAALWLGPDGTVLAVVARAGAEARPPGPEVSAAPGSPLWSALRARRHPFRVTLPPGPSRPLSQAVLQLLEGEPHGERVAFPLIAHGQPVGLLVVGSAPGSALPAETLLAGEAVCAEVEEELARILPSGVRRAEAAFEQLPESVLVTDREGRIVFVNGAFEKSTGYSRAEVLGQNPRLLKSGHQERAFYRELWAALRRGEVWHGRFVDRRRDGTLFVQDALIAPVRDERGRVQELVSVARDVSQELEGTGLLADAGRKAEGFELPPLPSGGEAVLLVDDEPVVRSALHRVLRNCGYRVLDAGSVPEALEVLEAEAAKAPVPMVVSDVMMPGESGVQLAARLLDDERSVRVVLMSGVESEQPPERMLRDPRVVFLQKPFSASVLARTVRELLDGPPGCGRP